MSQVDSTEPHEQPPRGRTLLVLPRLRRKRPLPSSREQTAIFLCLTVIMLLLGWSDGAIGPMIPFLRAFYGINYLTMSIIYICSFVGNVISGLTNIYLTDRLGLGIVALLAAFSQTLAYALMCFGGPYPLFAVAWVFNGFGYGLLDAQVNDLTSRLPSASTKMFLVQACYGLGATISPFIATAFIQHVRRAYLYFVVTMGLGLFTCTSIIVVLRFRTMDQLVGSEENPMGEDAVPGVMELGDVTEKTGPEDVQDVVREDTLGQTLVSTDHATKDTISPVPQEAVTAVLPDAPTSSGAKLSRIFTTPMVYPMLAYSFLYVGAEISIGGWLTSFLIAERGGTDSAGYATTGFFAGITLGRVVLIPVTHKLGSGIAIILDLIIWFTHNLIGNAVCFAFIGLVFGPVFPAILMVIAERLDDDLRGGVMGLLGSTSGAGAAALPFISGAISDRYGIWTLQPLVIATIGTSIIMWALVPRRKINAAV